MTKFSTKEINKNYMNFLAAYFDDLRCHDVSRHRLIADLVEYYYIPITVEYLKSNTIPQQLREVKYTYVKETGEMLPPGCVWISKSGRFSAHDMDYITGTQSYMLYDLKRKIHMPLVFHDLVGIDEDEQVIFCRTLPGDDFHSIDYDSPLRINLDWIEKDFFYESNALYPQQCSFKSKEDVKRYSEKMIESYKYICKNNQFDLSHISPVPLY